MKELLVQDGSRVKQSNNTSWMWMQFTRNRRGIRGRESTAHLGLTARHASSGKTLDAGRGSTRPCGNSSGKLELENMARTDGQRGATDTQLEIDG
jgi:hypothetical protein